jgi:hypothetical protein
MLLLGGCRTENGHSPTLDVLGSYFPAWMVCIMIGLAVTLIARQLLIALKLHAHLRPVTVVYVCLLIIFTMSAWLVLYQN